MLEGKEPSQSFVAVSPAWRSPAKMVERPSTASEVQSQNQKVKAVSPLSSIGPATKRTQIVLEIRKHSSGSRWRARAGTLSANRSRGTMLTISEVSGHIAMIIGRNQAPGVLGQKRRIDLWLPSSRKVKIGRRSVGELGGASAPAQYTLRTIPQISSPRVIGHGLMMRIDYSSLFDSKAWILRSCIHILPTAPCYRVERDRTGTSNFCQNPKFPGIQRKMIVSWPLTP